MALLVSYGLIAATLFVCDLIRVRILPLLVGETSALAGRLAADALLAVELCATAFEMGNIIEHHGMLPWTAALFCMAFYQVMRWRNYMMPCPYVHLLNALSGAYSATEAALRSAVLLASGLASYRLAKVIWSFELSAHHVGRHLAVDACDVPWADLPVPVSFASEFAGSAFLGVAPMLVLDNPTLANNDPIYSALAIAALVVATVTSCISFSGGMFNPVLATVLLGGCSGHDHWQHFLIYWVGATAGAMFAGFIYSTIKGMVYPAQGDKREGKKGN